MALKIRVRSLLTLLTILGLALQHRGLTCSYEELKLDTCPYQYALPIDDPNAVPQRVGDPCDFDLINICANNPGIPNMDDEKFHDDPHFE